MNKLVIFLFICFSTVLCFSQVKAEKDSLRLFMDDYNILNSLGLDYRVSPDVKYTAVLTDYRAYFINNKQKRIVKTYNIGLKLRKEIINESFSVIKKIIVNWDDFKLEKKLHSPYKEENTLTSVKLLDNEFLLESDFILSDNDLIYENLLFKIKKYGHWSHEFYYGDSNLVKKVSDGKLGINYQIKLANNKDANEFIKNFNIQQDSYLRLKDSVIITFKRMGIRFDTEKYNHELLKKIFKNGVVRRNLNLYKLEYENTDKNIFVFIPISGNEIDEIFIFNNNMTLIKNYKDKKLSNTVFFLNNNLGARYISNYRVFNNFDNTYLNLYNINKITFPLKEESNIYNLRKNSFSNNGIFLHFNLISDSTYLKRSFLDIKDEEKEFEILNQMFNLNINYLKEELNYYKRRFFNDTINNVGDVVLLNKENDSLVISGIYLEPNIELEPFDQQFVKAQFQNKFIVFNKNKKKGLAYIEGNGVCKLFEYNFAIDTIEIYNQFIINKFYDNYKTNTFKYLNNEQTRVLNFTFTNNKITTKSNYVINQEKFKSILFLDSLNFIHPQKINSKITYELDLKINNLYPSNSEDYSFTSDLKVVNSKISQVITVNNGILNELILAFCF